MITSLAAVAAVLGLFLLLVLLAKRPLTRRDWWLALWLAAQALFFISALVASTPFASGSTTSSLLLAAQCCLFVLGPAQYLYAATALGAPRQFAWHAAYITLSLLLLATIAAGLQLRVESGALVTEHVPRWIGPFVLMGVLLPTFYPIAILRLAKRYSSALQDQLSSLGSSDVGWLRLWAWTSLAAAIALALVIVAALVSDWTVEFQVSLSFLLQTASLAYAGYRGLTRPGVFLPLPTTPAQRPAKQNVDLAQAEADFLAVEQLLSNEKPHLEPSLTAQALADRLGWAPDRLTCALKHGGGVTFFDVINAARVREVQALAAQPVNARVSLLALAHDAGFGSKSAFYEAFQRHSGCSPATWRRNALFDKG